MFPVVGCRGTAEAYFNKKEKGRKRGERNRGRIYFER